MATQLQTVAEAEAALFQGEGRGTSGEGRRGESAVEGITSTGQEMAGETGCSRWRDQAKGRAGRCPAR